MAAHRLNAAELFQISNSYYLLYYQVDDELKKNAGMHTPKIKDLEDKREELRNTAETFSQLAMKEMAVTVKTPVAKLGNTIQEAANTIHKLQLAGKILDVVGDLVVIGGTLLETLTNPAAAAKLPEQVSSLIEDLKEIKTA